MADFANDLGFTFQKSKSGDVTIFHHEQRATTLRNQKAADFVGNMLDCDFAEQQQIMARLTGNYKRGNERTARNHLRNRR